MRGRLHDRPLPSIYGIPYGNPSSSCVLGCKGERGMIWTVKFCEIDDGMHSA